MSVSRKWELLRLVEEASVWPDEPIKASVAMIPKAAAGSRLQDERPITVLDVVYRVWAKGVVMAWATVLHREYLGRTVICFRAQSGTMYTQDLIWLQKHRGQPLRLLFFDLEKMLSFAAVVGTFLAS